MKKLLTCHALLVAGLLPGCSGLRLQETLKPDPSNWTMFAKDETRVNSTQDAVTPPLTLAWDYDISGGIGNGSPLVVDSVLFIGNLRGELYAINAFTGKRLGWIDLGDAIQGAPVIDGTTAIVALSNSEPSLISFDLVEGKPLWKKGYGDIEASPLLHNNRIYVGNIGGTFYCVDKLTGEMVWKYEIPENTLHSGIRTSAAGLDSIVVFGGEDGFLYALNAGNGRLCWRSNTGRAIAGSPCIAGEKVFVGNLAGAVSGFDLRSGKALWRFDAGASIYSSTSFSGGKVFVGTTAGIMYALDAQDGSLVWKTDLGGVINSGAVIASQTLYIGTLKKVVFGLQTSDGTVIFKDDVPGRVKTSPAVAHGRLYVATDEKLVICYRSALQ